MSYIATARQNKIDREELAAYRAQNSQRQMQEVSDVARNEGANGAYADVMQQMEASRAFNTTPEYVPQEAPSNVGLLDEVEGKLDKADLWYNNAIDSAASEIEQPRAINLEDEGRVQATRDFEQLLSNQQY